MPTDTEKVRMLQELLREDLTRFEREELRAREDLEDATQRKDHGDMCSAKGRLLIGKDAQKRNIGLITLCRIVLELVDRKD